MGCASSAVQPVDAQDRRVTGKGGSASDLPLPVDQDGNGQGGSAGTPWQQQQGSKGEPLAMEQQNCLLNSLSDSQPSSADHFSETKSGKVDVNSKRQDQDTARIGRSTATVAGKAADGMCTVPALTADPFLTHLLATCSLKPSALPQLLQQLHELDKRSALFFTRASATAANASVSSTPPKGSPAASAVLTKPVIQQAAAALSGCVDRVMQPLLASLERSMSHQQASTSSSGGGAGTVSAVASNAAAAHAGGGGGSMNNGGSNMWSYNPAAGGFTAASASAPGRAHAQSSWIDLDSDSIIHALDSACTAMYSASLPEVSRAMAVPMGLLHQLHSLSLQLQLNLPDRTFEVPVVSQLMALLSLTFFHKVVLESSDSVAAMLERYGRFRDALGWRDPPLATALDPPGKATMVYMVQAADTGNKRVPFTVRRDTAFSDALPQAAAQKLCPAPPPAAAPASVRGKASAKASTAHTDSSGWNLMVGTAAQACKVFPSFLGSGSNGSQVEAGEGHGPRKEFFALAGAELAGTSQAEASGITAAGAAAALGSGSGSRQNDSSAQHQQAVGACKLQLFVYNRTAGAHWFNLAIGAATADLQAAYRFAGWLLGQSLHNRAPLGLQLPPLLFQLLLQGTHGFLPTLETLEEFDPAAASGVKNAAQLSPGALKSMLELEELPVDWSAQQYLQHAVRQLLLESVRWQAESLAQGFFSALDRKALRTWAMGPEALADAISGGSSSNGPLDITHLFRVTVDQELAGAAGGPMIELLWQTLASWDLSLQRAFLHFVTGSARPPVPGTELLRIECPFVAIGRGEHAAMLGMLPQAHTCENLLELPNYWESLRAVKQAGSSGQGGGGANGGVISTAELHREAGRILEERLRMAVLNCSGYALDERGDGGGGREIQHMTCYRPSSTAGEAERASQSSGRGSDYTAVGGPLSSPPDSSGGGGSIKRAPLAAGSARSGGGGGPTSAAQRLHFGDRSEDDEETWRSHPVPVAESSSRGSIAGFGARHCGAAIAALPKRPSSGGWIGDASGMWSGGGSARGAAVTGISAVDLEGSMSWALPAGTGSNQKGSSVGSSVALNSSLRRPPRPSSGGGSSVWGESSSNPAAVASRQLHAQPSLAPDMSAMMLQSEASPDLDTLLASFGSLGDDDE